MATPQLPTYLWKNSRDPEQALGDNAEHAKVYTLGEFLAGRSHHLAIFGAEPVGHGNNRFKSGRNGDRCLFKSRTVDAVLQNSLKSDTRGIGGDRRQPGSRCSWHRPRGYHPWP